MAATGEPGLPASTAVGSRALVDTPDMALSAVTTVMGSEARGSTATFGRANFWGTVTSCRLSFSPAALDQVLMGAGAEEEVKSAEGGGVPTAPGQASAQPDSATAGELRGGRKARNELQEVGGDDPRPGTEQGLSILTAQGRSQSASPVQTPIAVPLARHQLILRDMARDEDRCLVGPQTASESLLQGLGTSPAPSILGPRPMASVPAR